MKKDSVRFSLYLDKRYTNPQGKHVIKLRLYDPVIRKVKYYSVNILADEEEYKAIQTGAVRGKRNAKKELLQEIEQRARKILDNLQPFTFQKFEDKMFRKAGDDINIEAQYHLKIEELKANNQISTANTYELSLKSLQSYYRGDISELTFYDIDVPFLKGYERHHSDKSTTTISIYLRSLRSIFNQASENIPNDIYPFGKRKYRIPTAKVKKTPLTVEDLNVLFHAPTSNPSQIKARDFWFLSYTCAGMNIKDMALLQPSDVDYKARTLKYYRSKTRTTDSIITPIIVHLPDYAISLIKKYSGKGKYVFDIVDRQDSGIERHRKIKAFTRYINQHLQSLTISAGLDYKISVQWARHAYATIGIRNGASIEFISEALGHSTIKTTQNYLDGFTNEAKKDFADNLMNFAYPN